MKSRALCARGGVSVKTKSCLGNPPQDATRAKAVLPWREAERKGSHMATQLGVIESGNRLPRQHAVQIRPESGLRTSRVRRPPPRVPVGETCAKQEPEDHNLLLAMAPLVKRVAYEMRHHFPLMWSWMIL